MEWLTETSIIQAGGICLAVLSLVVLLVVFKGYREQGKEFNKILTNHMHDAHEDKVKDIESRERTAEVLTKLIAKIDDL